MREGLDSRHIVEKESIGLKRGLGLRIESQGGFEFSCLAVWAGGNAIHWAI